MAATLRHRPDVLVIDLEMPEMDGLEAVAAILAERPQQPALMLTRHAGPGVLRRALRLGVQGFMSMGADPEEMVDVVTYIARWGPLDRPRCARSLRHRRLAPPRS
ncbi:hypothetical protein GCM10009625_01890 [Brachybacterium fresconis]